MELKEGPLKKTLDSMAERGIDYVYGRWLIEGAPRVILFDTKTAYRHLDEWKTDLWNIAGIPAPPGDDETNEAIVFGYLIAWFLGEVCCTSLHFLSVCILIGRIVHLPRTKQSRHRTFPRMACRCRSTSLSQTSYRCNHHLHHPCNLAWTLSLRRISRFLQQSPIL